MSEQKQWGGQRQGAGRTPIGDEPMEKHTVTLSPQDWQYLRAQGKNASEGLRIVIKFHKEHKQ